MFVLAQYASLDDSKVELSVEVDIDVRKKLNVMLMVMKI